MSVENAGVAKGLTCHSPWVPPGASYQTWSGLSGQGSLTVTLLGQ